MKKVLLVLLLLVPSLVLGLEYPKVYSSNVIIYDMVDDNVLYEDNSKEQVNIASLTKILTTITAIENIDNLDDEVIFSKEMKSEVAWDASIAGLWVGSKYTYRDLLYASMLPSGADATIALAISLSGSVDEYVSLMNELAIKVGMDNSHFVNVTGLDEEEHYSTLEDVLKLLRYALNNELFKEIYCTKKYTLSSNQIVYSTINKYSKNAGYDISPIMGSKTGFTSKAGLCISVLFNGSGHEMLLITTGAINNGMGYNVKDALDLIKFVNDNYGNVEIVREDELIKTLDIHYSNIDKYEVKTKKISMFLEEDYNSEDIIVEYEGLEELSILNKKEDYIGTVKYYYKDKLIDKEDIYLDIELKLSKEIKFILLGVIFVILLVIYVIIVRKKTKKRLRRS